MCCRRFFKHLCKIAGNFKKERGIKCSLVLEKEPHEESVGLKKEWMPWIL